MIFVWAHSEVRTMSEKGFFGEGARRSDRPRRNLDFGRLDIEEEDTFFLPAKDDICTFTMTNQTLDAGTPGSQSFILVSLG